MKKIFSKKEKGKAINLSGLSGKSKEVFQQLKNIRSHKLFQTVGMKLFLTFFISIVAFVSILGFFSYQISKNTIEERVSNTSHETIIKAREKIDDIHSNYEIFISHINGNSNPILTKYFDTPRGTPEKVSLYSNLQDRLSQFTNSDNRLKSIHIFEANGAPVIHMGSDFSNKEEIPQYDWFQKTVELDGGAYWIGPQDEGFSQRLSIGLARMFKDESNPSKNIVLLLEINLDNVSNILDQIVMGSGDRKLVLDEEGTVIYSSDNEQIGENVGFELSSNSTDQFVVEDAAGVEQLVVLDQSVDHTKWYIMGTVPMNEVIRGTEQIAQFSLIMVLLGAIVAIIVGYILARMFGKPLGQLRNLMQQGERGDLSVRANIRSKDELGQLGDSFNEMMGQITVLVDNTNQSALEVLNTATELSDVSKKTAMAAKEISVATEQIAGGASTLAVEAERGSDLTQSISSEMKSVVESNFQMGKSANEVQKVSEQGIEYMNELINKTNLTEQMTRSMSEKVDNLKGSTSSIRQILDVLNNISQQTNILSLNATIEAARAGDAGKGFVVIADEIRKLAEQSRQSIDVVGQITKGIQTEVEETVKVLSEAYPIFKEQTDSVRDADLIFKSVQGQMGDFIQHLDTVTNSIQQLEQSQTVLSEAMSSVSSVSQESSATSEEVASLSAEQLSVSDGLVNLAGKLENLSHKLKDSLSKFNT